MRISYSSFGNATAQEIATALLMGQTLVACPSDSDCGRRYTALQGASAQMAAIPVQFQKTDDLIIVRQWYQTLFNSFNAGLWPSVEEFAADLFAVTADKYPPFDLDGWFQWAFNVGIAPGSSCIAAHISWYWARRGVSLSLLSPAWQGAIDPRAPIYLKENGSRVQVGDLAWILEPWIVSPHLIGGSSFGPIGTPLSSGGWMVESGLFSLLMNGGIIDTVQASSMGASVGTPTFTSLISQVVLGADPSVDETGVKAAIRDLHNAWDSGESCTASGKIWDAPSGVCGARYQTALDQTMAFTPAVITRRSVTNQAKEIRPSVSHSLPMSIPVTVSEEEEPIPAPSPELVFTGEQSSSSLFPLLLLLGGVAFLLLNPKGGK